MKSATATDGLTIMTKREIFVFGSNLAGRHGKGAALYARERYGAKNGVGEGPTGDAYAIPTKDARLQTLPLGQIDIQVHRFCDYARERPDLRFIVTPIGTGLAGHDKRDIWRMFLTAEIPENCLLTSTWIWEPSR